MKNPLKNIFNYLKNKLQKIRNKNNKENKITEATKFETKEPTTEPKVKETKKLMDEYEKKLSNKLIFQHLNNNFNLYKNSGGFSSIATIKIFTTAMIDNYLRSKYSNIEKTYIDSVEHSIIEKLFTKRGFKLPNFDTVELNINFPNELTSKLILEKRDIELETIYTKLYAKQEKAQAQNALNKFFDKTDPENFENIEEKERVNTPKESIMQFFCRSTANAPKSSFIPKFIHKTATAGLGRQ